MSGLQLRNGFIADDINRFGCGFIVRNFRQQFAPAGVIVLD
jgi:hypothetical protein